VRFVRKRHVVRTLTAVGVCVGIAMVMPGVSHAETGSNISGSYVALGDSYTAGPLVPLPTASGPTPLLCGQSTQNYPRQVAAVLHSSTFQDASCSGATTADMFSAQFGLNPPQLDRLSDRTQLVTLSIGGNDINFLEIIVRCSGGFLLGCTTSYNIGGDQLAARIAAFAPKLAAVLSAIRQRAPGARVLVVGYPTVFPATPQYCPDGPFNPGDLPYLHATFQRLNDTIAYVASHAGDEYVDTTASSVGHDVCKLPPAKWIEGGIPFGYSGAPYHPNVQSMTNTAAQVLAALRSAD
jgi:lysophospholipase L1-like esterase